MKKNKIDFSNVVGVGVRNATYRTIDRDPKGTRLISTEDVVDGTVGDAGLYESYPFEHDEGSGETGYDVWEIKTVAFVLRDKDGQETIFEDPNKMKLYEDAPNTDLGFEWFRKDLLHWVLTGAISLEKALEISDIFQKRLLEIHQSVGEREQRSFWVDPWKWGATFERVSENPFSNQDNKFFLGGTVSVDEMIKNGFDVVYTSYHRQASRNTERQVFLGDRDFYAPPIAFVREGFPGHRETPPRPETFFVARMSVDEVADWPNGRDANGQYIEDLCGRYFVEVGKEIYDSFVDSLKMQVILDFNLTSLAFTRGDDRGGSILFYSQYHPLNNYVGGSPVTAWEVIHEGTSFSIEDVPRQCGYGGSKDTPAKRVLKWCYQRATNRKELDEQAERYFGKVQEKTNDNEAFFESMLA